MCITKCFDLLQYSTMLVQLSDDSSDLSSQLRANVGIIRFEALQRSRMSCMRLVGLFHRSQDLHTWIPSLVFFDRSDYGINFRSQIVVRRKACCDIFFECCEISLDLLESG